MIKNNNLNKINKIALFIVVSVAFFSLFSYSLGAVVNEGTPNNTSGTVNTGTNGSIPKLINPLKADYGGSVESLVFGLVNLAIFVGSIIAVFIFIWIGFQFVMAQGNPTAITKAKMWFLYAVIGTAILIGSKVIVDVMQNTLISAGVVDEKLFRQP